MKPLSPGLQVEGLQVQALIRRTTSGFVYRVMDTTLGRAFELEEYAPETLTEPSDSPAAAGALRAPEGTISGPATASEAWHEGRKRFLANARLQSQLNHPALPEVIRVIEANGTVYQLRNARDGKTLAELIEADASSAHGDSDKGLLMLESLAQALGQLHDQGATAGNISPRSIALDTAGQPFFVDLGHSEGPLTESSAETNPFLPPEAAEPGASANIAWDCYGLAATLLAWMDGKPPASAAQRRAALEAGEPDPVDLKALRQRGSLGDALAQALHMDPQERPESLHRWAESLRGVDARLSMIKTAGDEADPDERRPWGPLLLAGIITLLMLAAGTFLLSNRETPLDEWFQDVDMGAERDRGPRALAPTSEEQARWEAALDADTLLAYRSFMQDFPLSIFAEQAQLQIDILDERAWATLSAEDTRPAYVDYLEDFPTGLHQAEAQRRIEAIDEEAARLERERLERERQDNAAWATAREERTIASMQAYIEQWPAGLHIEEAQRTQRMLRDSVNDDAAFETATKLDTRDAFQAYIDAFPRGQYVTQALQAIDRLTLTAGKPFRDCDICPEMRVMPLGAFRQGAAPADALALAQERPQRVISFSKPFAVGIYEVTMGQWDACVEAGGCSNRPPDNGWGRGDRPVIMVSWNDALEYVNWLSEKTGQVYRLPSESEWEYFARADTQGPWLGDAAENVCAFGNIAGSETGFDWQHEACADPVTVGTIPVGALRPNKAGLFDVIGNVAEWTADCLNLSYLDAPTDGSAWTRGICSSHMTRGGSWVTGSRDIRLSSRFNLKNGDRNDFTGFRVVREIDE